ncbi:MAG TPA: hypothetical protein VGP30_06320, partial [Candidatus Limnocylindrales bacterium]|nr:hypothetical protein [Candidatus Limnocylindrales bacterium]
MSGTSMYGQPAPLSKNRRRLKRSCCSGGAADDAPELTSRLGPLHALSVDTAISATSVGVRPTRT